MLEVFSLTVTQILMMFTFMLIGFVLRKAKIGGSEMGKVLSALEVNVFLPAVCIKSFSENCTVKGIAENAPFLYAGIAVVVASFLLALLLSRFFGRSPLQRDVYLYSFLIPNIGYMGYPLVESVFGEKALFQMLIFAVPFNIVIYTYGMYILNPNRELNLKKILNPIMISIVAGIVLGLTGLRLPPFLDNVVVAAKNCMSPAAMILTGAVLASIPLKPVFADWRGYVAAVIRGVAIPALAVAAMLPLGIDHGVILITAATLAMPFGLNSIVFPAAFGGDSSTGARLCFISNLVSLISIPLVFTALEKIL